MSGSTCSGSPRSVSGHFPILGIRLRYAEKREPTSGLEPLTCSLRVSQQALLLFAEVCKFPFHALG